MKWKVENGKWKVVLRFLFVRYDYWIFFGNRIKVIKKLDSSFYNTLPSL